MTICDRCGVDLDTLPMGSWPFCKGQAVDHAPAHSGIITDDIPGGFVQTNFGHEPETFYSKQRMAKRAEELGLEPMVRWAGPHDKHVSRWVTMDAYTLEAAKALVERQTRRRWAEPPDEVPCDTARFEVTVKACS